MVRLNHAMLEQCVNDVSNLTAKADQYLCALKDAVEANEAHTAGLQSAKILDSKYSE